MSDREPEFGVAVWIALRRAHQGGVANLAAQWFDSGRRVPGYVADVLDRLVSGGLLALGDAVPEACGVRRVTVTDSGCARYVALCQIHNPSRTVSVSTPRRWAHCPREQRSHLLAGREKDQITVLIAVCGHRMPWSVPTGAQLTEPSCLTCEALAAWPVPAPQFGNTPDSGRPRVPEPPCPHPKTPAGRRSSCPVPAPGGQPDPTHRGGESSATAATAGHAQALCGRRLAPAGLTITSSAGALRLACIVGIAHDQQRPEPETHRPVGPRPTAGQDVPTAQQPIGHQPAPR